jgi:hypothetical protein
MPALDVPFEELYGLYGCLPQYTSKFAVKKILESQSANILILYFTGCLACTVKSRNALEKAPAFYR